jgi:DNA-binding MarR family transcriptional regulator
MATETIADVAAAPVTPDPSPDGEAAPARCLGTDLGWLLAQSSYGYACELAAALEPLGLGQRGYCVLSAALSGEFTQSQLAAAIGIDKTMMMVTLDELEARGLAERRRSAEDRRAHVVAVTAAGVRKVAEARRVIEGVQAEVLSSLPAREAEALLSGLARLVSQRLGEPPQCQPAPRRRQPRA